MREREDTTTFVDGACVRCGWPSFSVADNGMACEKCGRRIVFERLPQ